MVATRPEDGLVRWCGGKRKWNYFKNIFFEGEKNANVYVVSRRI